MSDSKIERKVMYACPCCRFLTLPYRGQYDICPVCFWEDEGVLNDANPDDTSGPNHISLNEARKNFKEYGACDKNAVLNVRAPRPDERPEAIL